jgi:hypoxanthine phosphoribosyltransferase
MTLDWPRFNAACAELAAKAQPMDPDAIVGIANGGAYVADAMSSSFLGRPHVVIVRLQRPATALKERLRLSDLLGTLPTPVTNFLRRVEVWAREAALSTRAPQESSSADLGLDPALARCKRILVVDDTVDSGRTLATVTEAVRTLAPGATVATAALATSWRRPPVMPDYLLYQRTLLRLPWSLDSR